MLSAQPNTRRILDAAGDAPRHALLEALATASHAGKTSSAETILGAINARFPLESPAAAEKALEAAVASRRWATVSYLADYLSDIALPASGGAMAAEAQHDFEEKLLRCLHGHVEDARRAEAPFLLTDEIQDTCVDQGTEFALSEAIVRCDRARELDPEACASAAVGGGFGPIRFAHVEADLPDGAFGSAADPSPYFNLGAPAGSLRTLQAPDEVVIPTPTARVLFDFPPTPLGQKPRTLTLAAPKGRAHFTRADLGRAVAARYRELADENGGAWSHDLSELDLVEVAPRPEAKEPGLYGLRVIA